MVKQFITLCVCAFMAVSAKADLMSDVGALQTGWAKAQYQLKDDPQEKAFLALIQQAKQATKTYPNAAEAWIWQGIIQSTYAGMASLFDQMDFVDGAKASLEKALKLDDKAMHGSDIWESRLMSQNHLFSLLRIVDYCRQIHIKFWFWHRGTH